MEGLKNHAKAVVRKSEKRIRLRLNLRAKQEGSGVSWDYLRELIFLPSPPAFLLLPRPLPDRPAPPPRFQYLLSSHPHPRSFVRFSPACLYQGSEGRCTVFA